MAHAAPIGRVVATELKPSTPHQFYFWTRARTDVGNASWHVVVTAVRARTTMLVLNFWMLMAEFCHILQQKGLSCLARHLPNFAMTEVTVNITKRCRRTSQLLTKQNTKQSSNTYQRIVVMTQ